MTLYCKREIVDAVQYTGINAEQIKSFCFGRVTIPACTNTSLPPIYLHKNREMVVVNVNDYVVKHQDGTFSVVNAWTFEKEYVEVV